MSEEQKKGIKNEILLLAGELLDNTSVGLRTFYAGESSALMVESFKRSHEVKQELHKATCLLYPD